MPSLAAAVAELERANSKMREELGILRQDQWADKSGLPFQLLWLRDWHDRIIDRMVQRGFLPGLNYSQDSHADKAIESTLEQVFAQAVAKASLIQDRKYIIDDVVQQLCESDPYDCQNDPEHALCISINGLRSVIEWAFEKHDMQAHEF